MLKVIVICMDTHSDYTLLQATVASLESRLLELSEIEQHRQSVAQKQLDELKQKLDAKELELQAAAEEAELMLLQLRQAQEELEHYFLLSRQQVNMLSVSETLSKKAVSLICKNMQ